MPNVNTLYDYYNLPTEVKQECEEKFNFVPWYVSATHPHCPLGIARLYLKDLIDDIQVDINQIGYYKTLLRNKNNFFANGYDIFYNWNRFKKLIVEIKEHFSLTFDLGFDYLKLIHKKFVDKINYLDSKSRCANIVNAVKNNTQTEIDCTLEEQAWVLRHFERFYNKKSDFYEDTFFATTQDLRNYFAYQS